MLQAQTAALPTSKGVPSNSRQQAPDQVQCHPQQVLAQQEQAVEVMQGQGAVKGLL
jgi:hypothetical protein